jgi:hypothetical protein
MLSAIAAIPMMIESPKKFATVCPPREQRKTRSARSAGENQPRAHLYEGFRGWRRPVVQTGFENQIGYRRRSRGHAWIGDRRQQHGGADERRDPGGRILGETLPAHLCGRMFVQRSYCVRRRTLRGTKARSYTNGKGTHGHQNNQRAPTAASIIFVICRALHLVFRLP